MTSWGKGHRLLWALGVIAGLSGCSTTGVLVGAGATLGITAAQERSMGDAIDDASIRLQLNGVLFNHPSALFEQVSIEVVEGRVLLTGNVARPQDRIEATRLAWTVGGVREVINEMQIADRSSILDDAADLWINTQLRARMLADADVLSINYTIETQNGVVHLLGVAQSEAELTRVTNHARVIRGVRKVVSHVLLRTDPRRPGRPVGQSS